MQSARRGGAIAAATAIVLVTVVAVMLGTRKVIPQAPGMPTATGTANSAACQGRLSWIAGASDASLLAVAASGPRDAWAVGVGHAGAVIQRWDGAGWSDVALPALGATSSILTAVAAVDARDAWAVGSADLRPLILHWDGTTWARVAASPPANAYSSQLSALAVVAPGDVWAVGSDLQAREGTPHTFAEHWDGHSWRIAPAPQGRTVTSLAASPGAAAWAIVTTDDDTQQIVRWDGQVWQQLPAPDPGAERLELQAIVAGPDGVAWAAGSYWPQGENWSQPIAERWDGHAWARVPASALEARGAWLVSLAVGKDGTIWAAGTLRNVNTRLYNVFLEHLGGQDTGMRIYPAFYADPHRGDSFNVSQIALAPGTDAAWLVGTTGSVPDTSLPPIDSNLPKASGAFVLRYC